MEDVTIRTGQPDDLPKLVEIYNHYILNGHITFDAKPVTAEDRRTWFESFTGGRYQLLVAVGAQGVLGCVTSSRYRDHPAFEETIETGIYLDREATGRGIGIQLYRELFRRLENEDVHLAVAGVALPNDASVALHRRAGFDEVGVFRGYAMKNGVRISSMWFQRLVKPSPC